MPPGETRTAGALLSAAWGEPVAVLAAEALRDRTHVFRLRLDGGRSAVLTSSLLTRLPAGTVAVSQVAAPGAIALAVTP